VITHPVLICCFLNGVTNEWEISEKFDCVRSSVLSCWHLLLLTLRYKNATMVVNYSGMLKVRRKA
jgi:hypothetical protein